MPLPLREEVSKELQRMKTMEVISRVDVPTPWWSGMVVAPKKSSAVRICVKLKPLNKSVLREVHPLPKVDNTLTQLANAKLFSKLDVNSGFWQIQRSPASRLFTTFNRKILFQQTTLRNLQCAGTLPEANERYLGQPGRGGMSDGRYSLVANGNIT